MLRISISCEGSAIGESYFSDDEPIITIGRALGNDIMLPDPAKKVSRHHAVLIKPSSLTDSRFVRDLGSRYGVRVRQQLTRCAHLGDGEAFTLADYTLSLSMNNRSSKGDRLRIVSKREPQYLHDASTMGFENDSKFNEPAATARHAELRAELAKLAVFDEVSDIAGTLMPALCAAVQARKGFLRLFRDSKEESHVDLGIVGMEESDAIEVADSQFLRRIKKGRAFVESDVVLSPIMNSAEAMGFIAVSKPPASTPFSSDDVSFLVDVSNFIGKQLSADTVERQPSSNTEAFHWPGILIGNNAGIKELKQQIASAAESRGNVLILGETGTGKELVAREIHRVSHRNGQFLPRNAAQITESLAESVLFGYVPRSGIAGANINGSPGWFELADGGTLFLDEVHGLSTSLQDTFLRVLQEKEISRIGARASKVVDVKIVAATDFDLEKAMDEGTFRRAFYFRFGERISLAPLRERKQEIPLLAYYFLDSLGGPSLVPRCISHKAMDCLVRYEWPGNVRELQSCMKSAALTASDVIFTWNLPDYIHKAVSGASGVKEDNTVTPISNPRGRIQTLVDLERDKIIETLEVTRGNKTQAALLLGITRVTLLNKMDKFGIARNYGEILNMA